jgi:hypothetical protein
VTTRATLGGVPLSANGPISWGLTSGTVPYTAVFELTKQRAEQIFEAQKSAEFPDDGPGPLTLEIEAEGKPKLTVGGLSVLVKTTGTSPYTASILVSDVRYKWQRVGVFREYNVRRESGERRILPASEKLEDITDPTAGALARVVNDIWYAPWSLKREPGAIEGTEPYTARDVAEDILEAVTGGIGGWEIRGEISAALPIENILVSGNGATAIATLLRLLPGWNVYVDREGRTILYNTLDQTERDVVENKRRIQVGSGYWAEADRSQQRPYRVRVLFERQIELRFDYNEDSQNPSQTKGADDLRMDNVLSMPDLTYTGTKVYTRGEYAPIGDYGGGFGILSEWQLTADDLNGNEILRLSQQTLRDTYMPGFRRLLDIFGLDPSGEPNPVNARRVGSILRSWRKQFQIRRQWVDRMRRWWDYRVAIVDTERGTRAPSEAYMDYTIRPSWRAIVKEAGGPKQRAWEVDGYADSLTGATPAPFRVRQVDESQGVFTVSPASDPWGEAQAFIPGKLETIPTFDLREINKLKTAAGVQARWDAVSLSSAFKLSVIVTASPAAPNNDGRFHEYIVNSWEAARTLDIVDVGESSGPEWTVYIGASLMTAKYAWADAEAKTIKDAFQKGGALPDSLLLNPKEVQAVAEAAAARIYSGMLDRPEGFFGVDLDPSAEPTGNMGNVQHALGKDGSLATSMGLPPTLGVRDLEPYLPMSVLRVVRRLAQ